MMSPIATILIPTCNRPLYLQRCLAFYQHCSQQFQIIVLDSSNNSDSAAITSQYPHVTYHKLPYTISFSAKLAAGGQMASTDFVSICSDDDFIFPQGIRACVSFLTRQPDFVAAHGKYLRHIISDDGKLSFAETYRGKLPTVLDSDLSPAQRLIAHYGDYVPTFYATTRTDIFRTIYQLTAESGVEFGLSEVLPSSLTVLMGKVGRIHQMYACREAHQHDWVTDERKVQMYSADKTNRAISLLAVTMSQQQPEICTQYAHELLTQLLIVGKGMASLAPDEHTLQLRHSKSNGWPQSFWVQNEEAKWASDQVAQILLKYCGYTREQMIQLREALYL